MARVSAEPMPGIVLQCGSCSTIVGDTSPADFVGVCSLEDAQLVVLRAATSVTVDRIAQGGAQGGTHFPICCSACGSALGRVYTAAPPGAPALAAAFSFDAARCTSYRVGSADIRVGDAPAAAAAAGGGGSEATSQGGGAAAPRGGAAPAAPAAAPGEALAARVEALEAELLRMQGVILLHDARLRALPESQGGGAPG